MTTTHKIGFVETPLGLIADFIGPLRIGPRSLTLEIEVPPVCSTTPVRWCNSLAEKLCESIIVQLHDQTVILSPEYLAMHKYFSLSSKAFSAHSRAIGNVSNLTTPALHLEKTTLFLPLPLCCNDGIDLEGVRIQTWIQQPRLLSNPFVSDDPYIRPHIVALYVNTTLKEEKKEEILRKTFRTHIIHLDETSLNYRGDIDPLDSGSADIASITVELKGAYISVTELIYGVRRSDYFDHFSDTWQQVRLSSESAGENKISIAPSCVVEVVEDIHILEVNGQTTFTFEVEKPSGCELVLVVGCLEIINIGQTENSGSIVAIHHPKAR